MATRAQIADALRRLAPGMPDYEFDAVLGHARDSRGLRGAAPETAAWLSLVAFVRHTMTDYDDLLAQGYDQDSARFFVTEEMHVALAGWGVRRKLAADD